MIYLPKSIHESIVMSIYIILGIVLFLWGRAVGVNQTTELYKLQDEKSEIMKLRRENTALKYNNAKLTEKNKFYLSLQSSMKHLVDKGENNEHRLFTRHRTNTKRSKRI